MGTILTRKRRTRTTRTRPHLLEPVLGRGNYIKIARGAGLTPSHVGRVLRGLRGASFHVAARIAVSANVTLDQMYDYIYAQSELTIRGRQTQREIRARMKYKIKAARELVESAHSTALSGSQPSA